MNQNAEKLIYLPNERYTDLMKRVETALGIKLFVWQWNYILKNEPINGRRTGKTTAYCLSVLLTDIKKTTIVIPRMRKSGSFESFRSQLYDIKEKLTAAGIETNEIKTTNYGEIL